MDKRKTKMLNGEVHTFFIKGQRNPCGCGSNCFHKVDDGMKTYGVCNACNRYIYEYKERDLSGDWA